MIWHLLIERQTNKPSISHVHPHFIAKLDKEGFLREIDAAKR